MTAVVPYPVRFAPPVVALLIGATPLWAQTNTSPCGTSARARIALPALDAPYNVANGYRAPSMPQALAVSASFYEVSHRAIQQAWRRHTLAGRLSVLGWDLFNTLVMPLPASDAWVHEEYHRAVLGRRGIDSFNDFAAGP